VPELNSDDGGGHGLVVRAVVEKVREQASAHLVDVPDAPTLGSGQVTAGDEFDGLCCVDGVGRKSGRLNR
jgi:hypothetical protein